MSVPAHDWAAGERITANKLNASDIQRGSVSVSFTQQTTSTVNVVFPEPFPTAPNVQTNIAAAPGSSSRWTSRAINVTATGFTIFLESGYATAPAVDWIAVPVTWIAVAQ